MDNRTKTKEHFSKLLKITGENEEGIFGGIINAINYDWLLTRHRNKLLDEICAFFNFNQGTKYSKNYVISYNEQGKIGFFNPNPIYPQDFYN